MNEESQDSKQMIEMFYPVRETGQFVQYLESISKDHGVLIRQYGMYGVPVTVRVHDPPAGEKH